MKGTEKQIKWAESIKASFTNTLDMYVEKFENPGPLTEKGKELATKYAEKFKKYSNQMKNDNEHDASYFIENRDAINSMKSKLAEEATKVLKFDIR